jgi:hypothetical protein
MHAASFVKPRADVALTGSLSHGDNFQEWLCLGVKCFAQHGMHKQLAMYSFVIGPC